MARKRALLPLLVCLALGALAPAAMGATQFHPRIRGAMGLVPPVGSQDVASGALTPVLYHGGSVMAGGVVVHTIFWAPAGFSFTGPPSATIPGYEAIQKQFLVDSSTNSGATSNVFSVLPQFAQGTQVGGVTPNSYSIAYNPATNSIDDTDAYPAAGQCASPDNITTCVTDAQVQAEVDHIVQSTPGTPRGLHNIWYVFLPPNVDECIQPGVCGSNAFGGYHSLSNISGHGVTIYAVGIDPLIEVGGVPPGQDPQGNPEAELEADITAHEVTEAMTDPEGVGWMDPNGFEVGDKCEFGPQRGTPLGFAGPDRAPFNQVINGHDYLIQMMWSNDDNGCVQRTGQTGNPLPLPQVNMTQFSSTVTGNIGSSTAGVGVKVTLQRSDASGNPVTVASGTGTTDSSGTWSLSLAPHAVGDDRDQITVDYSGSGAPSPTHQVILTGNGGNPFTESGWTGWTDLDNSSFVTNNASLGGPSLSVGPCFQTGVLSATFSGTPLPSPTDTCSTQTDAGTVSTPPIGRANALTVSSNDNRAFSPTDGPTPNRNGGLVRLTVPTGEADAVSTFQSPMPFFNPTGFPSCAADLEAQAVQCTGLVSGENYTVTDTRTGAHFAQSADNTGTIAGQVSSGLIDRGDLVTLSNGSRTLTTLHVAHLRVDITEQQTVLASGSCQPGAWYGPPLSQPPTNSAAGGPGVALSGAICPLNGDATGFDNSAIAQTDELSGGATQTEVPNILDTSPIHGETVYGTFTALAESGLPGPNNSTIPTDSTSRIAVTIAKSSGGAPVFHSSNVDTANGVTVKGLKSGTYTATWTMVDANGDTRTMTTRFIEVGAATPTPSGPKAKVSCATQAHDKIKCTVSYPRGTAGSVQLRLTSGGKVIALGKGKLKNAKLTLAMKQLHKPSGKVWTATLVLTEPHKPPVTSTATVRT